MRKKLFTFLLAMVTSVGHLVAANVVESGTCGAKGNETNVTWTLTEDGTLTISGTGEMANFAAAALAGSAPWYSSRASIKKIVISNGITNLGTHISYEYGNLKEVEIGEDVVNAYSYSFYQSGCPPISLIWNAKRCETGPFNWASVSKIIFGNKVEYIPDLSLTSAVKNISIPNSVVEIGKNAFSNSGITEIVIPDNVRIVGSAAFSNCTQLTQAIIGEGVEEFGANDVVGVFAQCTNLETITWNAKRCEYNYKSGIANLKKVIIGPNVEALPNNFCYNFTALEEVNLPASIKYIGTGAFYNCSSCKYFDDLILPENLEYIGDYAFFGTTIQKLTLPNSALTISPFAFADISIKELTIPENVQYIGTCAFDGCTSLAKIYYNALSAQSIVCYDEYFNPSYTTYYASPFTGLNSVEVYIGKDVKSIGGYMFAQKGRRKHSSNKYPYEWSSETPILRSQYYNDPKLTSKGFTTHFNKIIFEEGSQLQEIGNGTFAYCSDLKQLDLPESLTYIDECAFIGCSGLTELIIPGNVVTIKESALSECNSLKKLIIPSSVNVYTGGYKWGNNDGISHKNYLNELSNNLDSITCPANMFDFAGGTSWSAKYICVNNGTLTDNAFAVINRSYKTLKTLDISATKNTSLVDEAFKGCYNLEQVYLPKNLQQIGYQTFGECFALKELTLPETLTEIGSKAFTGCDNLDLVISNAVVPPTIGSTSFDSRVLTAGTLRVPCGSRNVYAASAWGNYFSNITEDYTYNVSIIANNASMGTVTFDLDCENNQATIMATANEGYRFVQWSDESQEAGRVITLTQDTSLVAQFEATPTITEYAVYFLDWDGSLLSEQMVESGNAPLMPTDPERDGFRFTGWSANKETITERTFIIAQYEKESVGVPVYFVDAENNLISTSYIADTAPEAPFLAEKSFIGWKVLEGNIAEGVVIQATYEGDAPQSLPSIAHSEAAPQKILHNGQIYILRGDKIYSITGNEIQ